MQADAEILIQVKNIIMLHEHCDDPTLASLVSEQF